MGGLFANVVTQPSTHPVPVEGERWGDNVFTYQHIYSIYINENSFGWEKSIVYDGVQVCDVMRFVYRYFIFASVYGDFFCMSILVRTREV